MTEPKFIITDSNWSEKLEQDFVDYMWGLQGHLEDEDNLPEGYELPETLSGEPYCGCSTCETREQLFFLVPRILAAYKAKQIVIPGEENTDV